MSEETLFDLPISPEEFGVVLPPPDLRNLDYTSLDFANLRRTTVEYIRTYYPDDFNDFVASNGIIMLVEILAAVGSKLGLRGDLLFRECFFPTAKTENAIVNHLSLIGQKRQRAMSAVVDVEVSVTNQVSTEIEIPPGIVFEVKGPDSQSIYYEVYKSPDDLTSNIIIQPNKRGVVAFGIEGKFADDYVVTSVGGPDQSYSIQSPNILEFPLKVTVESDDTVTEWTVISDDLESHGPTEKVVSATLFSDRVEFKFGNNTNGAQPLSGQNIRFRYRVGGGTRGRIGVGVIDKYIPITPNSLSSSLQVRFRNITPSTGGVDLESIESVKKRAPKTYAMHNNITTPIDYATAAISYTHPVFGTVAKAIASVKTSINANIIQLHVLTYGNDNLLATASLGLKNGLQTHIMDLNPLSTVVEVVDGRIKNIDLEMVVTVSSNSNAAVVKTAVDNAIAKFFDLKNWDMGRQLYISDIITTVKSISGVLYVNLISPLNNILLEDGEGDDIVNFDEIIVLGSQKIQYYYEKPRR